MYTSLFKLRELPFRLAPDPRFHFLAESREPARTRLRHGLRDVDGCVVLTGESGMGKTSLALDLLQEYAEPNTLVHIRNPDLSIGKFYQLVLSHLDERPAPSSRSAVLAAFDTCLAREAAMCRSTVIFIDNAEQAPLDLLDEVLRMSRRRSGNARQLRVMLAGAPSFVKLLMDSSGRARAADIGLTEIIGPLDRGESARYLRHRIEVAAAAPATLFDVAAEAEMFRFAGGVPRRINVLADAALARAYDAARQQVGAADVRAAADALQWVEYAANRPGNADSCSVHADSLAEPSAVPEFTSHLAIERNMTLVAEFDLPLGKISMGRAVNNDVRIDSPYISRHHCQVLTTPQYSVIEDLQSQNGIVVGKRRVSVHRLQHGDRVSVGDYTFVFSRLESGAAGNVQSFPLILRRPVDVTDVVETRLMIRPAPAGIP